MDGDPRQASISLPIFRALTESASSGWRDATEQAILSQLDSIVMVQDGWLILTEKQPTDNQKRCFISSLWRSQVITLQLPVLCRRVAEISATKKLSDDKRQLLEQGFKLLEQLAAPVQQKTPHHMFSEFASAYCGDELWQLHGYSTDAAALFESWGAGKLDLAPLDQAMTLVLMNELWNFGEKSFAEPLLLEAEQHHLRLPHDWFEHAAATNFQLAHEALLLIARALDWQPDVEQLREFCQCFIRRKAAIMASLMEMLLQSPQWIDLQLAKRTRQG